MSTITPKLKLTQPDYRDPRWDLPINTDLGILDDAHGTVVGVYESIITSPSLVDCFIYDTSKDSDGGAWRDRCQTLSWYNEELNTADRGKTRKFPAVALIVAEADKVTIYDMTDPSLPMWMVFNQGTNTYIRSETISSVFMLNGNLFVGGSTIGSSWTSFIDDRNIASILASVTGRRITLPISGRNNTDGIYRVQDVEILLVNSNVNDVAMTILPTALVDPATGLPVPTIAVATDGGVSVIDGPAGAGTVVHITYGGRGNNNVAFSDEYRLIANLTLYQQTFIMDIPLANVLTNPPTGADIYSNTTVPALFTSSNRALSAGVYGSLYGLVFLKENPLLPSAGMVNYLTDSYLSGWMQGDIKMAALADTVEGDIVNLWTDPPDNMDAEWADNLDGSYTADGSQGGAITLWNNASLGVGTEKSVFVTVSGFAGGSLTVYLGSTNTLTITSDGTHQLTGVVSGDGIGYVQGNATFIGTVSNIIQQSPVNDRSVNNNPLQVVGTITKTAVNTGADLVAYSGFGTVAQGLSYIEQPYNADLDFSTGDFYVMSWFKAVATLDTLLERNDSGIVGPSIRIDLDASGYVRVVIGGDIVTGTVDYATNSLHMLVVKRVSGVGYIFIDGVQVATGPAADSIINATAVTRIGLRLNDANSWGGILSLFRMGAGAPSDEQIEMIYNQEKKLFEADASFLLPDNDVQDVDFDDIEKTLVVATALGVNKYRDLIRIGEVEFEAPDGPTTLPILNANAVSANNGAVAVTTSVEGGIALPALNIREEFTALEGKIPDLSGGVTEIQLTPTTDPEQVEGKVFYDADKHALSVYSDVDMTLNFGQEEVIRVINNSGAVIPNASPVQVTGASSGLPEVALAQANSFTSMRVPGITTHEIPIGQEGFITHAGSLGGDFSSWGIGSLLFLSESIAGGYTDSPPSKATRLGQVTSANTFLVNIGVGVEIPAVIAFMNEAVDPIGDITATPQDVINYQDGGANGLTSDWLAGYISLPVDGIYRVTFNLSINFTAVSQDPRELNLQLYNSTLASEVFTIKNVISKEAITFAATISAPFTATAGDYKFRIATGAGEIIEDVIYNFTSYDIQSVHIR
ncbi:MAG: hypothetical protein DRJ03_02410 [Chloroflexi bacterium]|nr:MAG: hypothetical protein DRJ03_02410 [Chloroflexota bacterium]